MRPPSIIVSGGRPRSVEDFLHRARGGPGKPAKPTPRAKFLGSDGRELKRPGIQGWACFYGQAFFATDRYRVIKTGALAGTIFDAKPKQLLFDHDPDLEIGSTETGLVFATSTKGLAFRMPLDGNPNAAAIYEGVMGNTTSCVSIGADVREKEVRKTKDGVEYDYITLAGLREISLCEQGAVSNTYCRVVDLAEEEPDLWKASQSSKFQTDQAVANVSARGQRIADMLKSLRV